MAILAQTLAEMSQQMNEVLLTMPETGSTSDSLAILAQTMVDDRAFFTGILEQLRCEMQELKQSQFEDRAFFTGMLEQLRGEIQELKLSRAKQLIDEMAGEVLSSENLNSVTIGSMDTVNEALIPGLPDDLALICLAKISHGFLGVLECVCKRWRNVIPSEDYVLCKSRMGKCGDWLFVSVGTEESQCQWKAYDPETDRWHDVPPMPRLNGGPHIGFSCVSVCNRFLVLGGLYETTDSGCYRSLITNQVLSFDPYRQEWSVVASMSTPRMFFACSVICNKVYVGGGRNHDSQHSCIIPLSSAEVYDPVENRWEDLPTMPYPRNECFGVAYNSQFYVLDDVPNYDGTEIMDLFIFSPFDGQWRSIDDKCRKPPLMIHDICVINDQVYTYMSGDNCKEKSVQTFNTETGEWVWVGLVPAGTLPENPEVLNYICGLRNKFYIMGGEGVATGAQKVSQGSQYVPLKTVRFCDPSTTPLHWGETTVPGGDCDEIASCGSLEERQL